MLKTITIAMTTSTLLMLSGCSESSSSPQAQAPSNENTTETTPYAWVLTSAPAGDVSITEAKANAIAAEARGDRQARDQLVQAVRVAIREAVPDA